MLMAGGTAPPSREGNHCHAQFFWMYRAEAAPGRIAKRLVKGGLLASIRAKLYPSDDF